MPDRRSPSGPRLLIGDQSVTTRATLSRDLELSLGQSIAIKTVGNLVESILRQGFSLSDPISSIEFGVGQGGTGRLRVERDDEGRLAIAEIYR